MEKILPITALRLAILVVYSANTKPKTVASTPIVPATEENLE